MIDASINAALAARSSEFHSVLMSTVVTDASGNAIETESSLSRIIDSFVELRSRGSSLYVIGNGGSAAVAAHIVTDFLNVASLRAATIHDSSIITCMANDYGYENAYARMLSVLVKPKDVVVAISSSGKSANICNAVLKVRELGGEAITLSGFAPDNPLRGLGDINIWLDSRDYGMVENGHQFILHNIADRIPVK